MKWTQRQLEAIETRGKNILVSAAAGSGKTAVLVERILRIIIEERVNVDNLLVVTFTNAAASEMREKIAKAIKKKAIENPEEAPFLKRQLELLNRASISTFHAFAIDIIRRYFYVEDINPNLKVADEVQIGLMKVKAMDEVFENNFKRENNSDFIDFLKRYSSHKNENNLKKSLLKLYDRIMAMPKPFQWLENAVKNMNIEVSEDGKIKRNGIFKYIIDEIELKIKESIEFKKSAIKILEEALCLKLAYKVSKDCEELEKCLKAIDESRYDECIYMLNNYKNSALRATKEEKEAYEAIKDNITSLIKASKDSLESIMNDYLYDDLVTLSKDVKETKKYLLVIKDILEEYDKIFKCDKLEKKIMDFNDIEHYAIEILSHEDVASECRQKFKYIFIDEYQDSNLLQEVIIDKIKRDNNLFLVGDIKQSIYRFRLAEPDIFRKRYVEYGECEDQKSIKIDLNQNFRCKQPIVDTINEIFSDIMENYDDNAALHLGVEPVGMEKNVELIIIDNEKSKYIAPELEKAEVEAAVCVKRIKELVGTQFYDHKAGVTRELRYKDIVILMRSVSSWGEAFEKVFKKNDIPIYLNAGMGYFETLEINLIMDLLKVIDNSCQDIPLLGVLKSTVFEFTNDELIEIRLNKKYIQYNKALKLYAKDGKDEKLKLKCQNVLDKLHQWKEEARCTPMDTFSWYLMKESGIYTYVATLPNGDQRQFNLRTFIDKTANYCDTGDNSIYGLLKYIDKIKENGGIAQDSMLSEDDDIVRLMTIHKSKGLEYPVVIIPGLSKKFNNTKSTSIDNFHKDLGIGIEYCDYDRRYTRNTILQNIIVKKNISEELEEELRVLYVAMTRAQDRLIMIGNMNKGAEYLNKILFGSASFNNFLDYIIKGTFLKSIESLDTTFVDIEYALEYNRFNSTKKEEGDILLKEFVKEKPNLKNDHMDHVKEVLDYVYPNQKEMSVKSKYSVSELNQDAPMRIIKKYKKKAVVERKISGALIGTAYHTAMEYLDFNEATEKGESYINSVLDNLVLNGMIEEDVSKFLSTDKFLKFFESQIGKRATKNNPQKEKMFTMLHEVNGVETIVQGIIDCYFEEDGEIVLLDYKTNFDTKYIKEEYEKQIELYKEALEEATGKRVKESWLYLFEDDDGLLVM